jgi:hypothetical protein
MLLSNKVKEKISIEVIKALVTAFEFFPDKGAYSETVFRLKKI